MKGWLIMAKKDYGTVVSNAGKKLEQYGQELEKIGSVVKNENLTFKDRLDYLKKRNIFILNNAKRSYKKYLNDKEKSIGYHPEIAEQPHSIGVQIEKAFELIINQSEEIKALKTDDIDDYIEIFQRYHDKTSLSE